MPRRPYAGRKPLDCGRSRFERDDELSEDDERYADSLLDEETGGGDRATGASLSRASSTRSSASATPVQRIKSLTNFRLYLSPSKFGRALTPCTTDDSGRARPEEAATAPEQREDHLELTLPRPRRILQPVKVDIKRIQQQATLRAAAQPRASSSTSTASLRLKLPDSIADASGAGRKRRPGMSHLRPPSQLRGVDDENMRSYSDRLQLHHARAISACNISADTVVTAEADLPTSHNPPNAFSTPEPSQERSPSLTNSQRTRLPQPKAISPFSRSSNPWFGYPALMIPSSGGETSSAATTAPGGILLRPQYPKNRYRDLLKTLLFLFLLRLHNCRETLERKLGLDGWRRKAGSVSSAIGSGGRDDRYGAAMGPSEGLAMAARQRASATSSASGMALSKLGVGWERDLLWWMFGFLVVRGSWARLVESSLDTVGSWFGAEGIRRGLMS